MEAIKQIPNHIYKAKTGEKIIYLGKASLLRLPDGFWQYPLSNIYIKEKDILRLGLTINSSWEDILAACTELNPETPHLYFSEKFRPVVEDLGVAFPDMQFLYDRGEFNISCISPKGYVKLSFMDHR